MPILYEIKGACFGTFADVLLEQPLRLQVISLQNHEVHNQTTVWTTPENYNGELNDPLPMNIG